jgi:hypothetical protein
MIPIWLRALTSPFANLSQLPKFGAIPVLLTVGIELVETLLVSTGIIVMAAPFWTLLAFTIAYVPFEVGWTRLTINGPAAVADRSYFALARTESHNLVATILFEEAWTVTLVPAFLMRLGTRNFDWHLVFEGGISPICGVRRDPRWSNPLALYISCNCAWPLSRRRDGLATKQGQFRKTRRGGAASASAVPPRDRPNRSSHPALFRSGFHGRHVRLAMPGLSVWRGDHRGGDRPRLAARRAVRTGRPTIAALTQPPASGNHPSRNLNGSVRRAWHPISTDGSVSSDSSSGGV